jgi:peroxiredoxin
MKKKILKLALMFSLLLATTFLVSMIYRKMEVKKTVANNIKKIPHVRLKNLNNSDFYFPDNSDFHKVLIFFHTECEHCQNEVSEIKKHIELFEKTKVYFISIEPIDTIKKFTITNNLTSYSNLSFKHIEGIDSNKQFGIVTFPTIFIYGKENNLLKQYLGEAKLEAITKYLK